MVQENETQNFILMISSGTGGRGGLLFWGMLKSQQGGHGAGAHPQGWMHLSLAACPPTPHPQVAGKWEWEEKPSRVSISSSTPTTAPQAASLGGEDQLVRHLVPLCHTNPSPPEKKKNEELIKALGPCSQHQSWSPGCQVKKKKKKKKRTLYPKQNGMRENTLEYALSR